MLKQDFNKDWTVRKSDNQKTKVVNLPYDAMLYEARSRDEKTGGACAYFRGGKYIFHKNLTLTEALVNKTLIMECEGVYQNAEIYVNGKKINERPYGYSNFFTDLTPHLSLTDENTIEIIADNEKTPNSRWYSGSGIYREVQLYTAGKDYIIPEGVQITTLENHHVNVKTRIEGKGDIFIEIKDHEKIVASGSGIDTTLSIEAPILWDEANPYLYTCHIYLKHNGTIVDEDTVRFGIRTLKWDGNGLLINGKNTLLKGACIHHDNGPLGACGFRDAEYRRIRLLKEAGFNSIRSSHNPASKAMLDACDELGMYVIDEMYDYWLIHKNPYDLANEVLLTWWKQDIDSMINKNFNHPSVLMYSIGNEISEFGTSEGQLLCREMSEYTKNADPSRAVTAGINLLLASMTSKGKGLYGTKKNGKENKNGSSSLDSMPTSTFFNILMNRMGSIIDLMASTASADKICDLIDPYFDIPGYNYATSRYNKEFRTHPERCIVGSETLPKMLYRNWQKVKVQPNLIGDFMWVGWDYLGETGIGTIRYIDKTTKKNALPGLAISAGSGVIDICGKLRPEVGWNQFIWEGRTKAVLCVDPVIYSGYKKAASMWRNTDAIESWSWYGYEGNSTTATVYTNADFVELYCNGKRLGRKKVHQFIASFPNVIYEPGKLVAICFDNKGHETDRVELVSAYEQTRISLRPDRTSLCANGQDLCFIDVDLTDDNGITESGRDDLLTVTVEGSGVLQGFGSALPNTEHNFYEGIYRTYYGKALIIIRAGYEPGNINISVRGKTLPPVKITIPVK